MPEYLAPAVYVEEVSFRSKPLEGVSTSTTAFVGPTATGPIDDVPELITGVGDFERVYGGTRDLEFGLNYVAHAVRAFFDNGGRRLYIARTYEAGPSAGLANTAFLLDAAGGAPNARFEARFPGSAGNGRVILREQRTPTSSTDRRPLDRAPIGTLIRTGTTSPATPSSLPGGQPPFVLTNGAQMAVTAGAAPVTVTFTGESASVTGTPDFSGGPIVVDASTAPLTVNLNGTLRTVAIPAASYADIQALADALNIALVGGFVVVSGSDLRLGSEVRGRASSVTVVDGAFGFADGATASRSSSTDSVPDLGRVSASDLGALLTAAGLPVTVTVGLDQLISIATVATGASAALSIAEVPGAPSAPDALGITPGDAPAGTGTSVVQFYVKRDTGFQTGSGAALPASGDLGGVEFLSLNVITEDAEGHSQNFEELGYDVHHPRYVGSVLAAKPLRRSDELENRIALAINADEQVVSWPFALRGALLGSGSGAIHTLAGGSDGLAPSEPRFAEALEHLRSLEDISILAAPGSSIRSVAGAANAIRDRVITFVERRRSYQIAVIDTPPQLTPDGARSYRGEVDSKYAALYYPWIKVANPNQRAGDLTIPREILVPPSGFVCGIYARNDAERGVHKAPANEVVRGTLSFETFVNFAQQESLNPAGVNALRFFPGRGFRVWGARLAASDPEWKYVSLRRYFNYVEASIDRGTQWVVFEPNGERLWQRVRNTVSDFLFTEWRNGALLGSAPAEAFFVRVDRTTMTQNDLDNGRLIVEVGMAVVNPAEFVIFRIGQKTSEARS